VVNVVGTFVLLVLLRKRLGRLDVTRTMSSVVRISLASLVLAGVAYGIWWPLDHELGRRFVAQLVSLGLALAVGGAAYYLVCRLLRVDELRALRLLRRRSATA
jgi:putative peptidoglycan lipid II flippase